MQIQSADSDLNCGQPFGAAVVDASVGMWLQSIIVCERVWCGCMPQNGGAARNQLNAGDPFFFNCLYLRSIYSDNCNASYQTWIFAIFQSNQAHPY
jgi:hypothetical protein